MQAMSYQKKLSRYSGMNILAQTLTESFYENNPQLVSFIDEEDVPLIPISVFNKAAMESRLGLYKVIAKKIWSLEAIRNLA